MANDLPTLIVLGMHRSGTSLVAGALCRGGAWAGAPEDLLAEQVDNPKGFWERRDVVALNDQILARAGLSWFNPPATGTVVATGTTPANSSAEPLASTRDLLSAFNTHAAVAAPSQPRLLKDPRLSLTWSAWQPVVSQPLFIYVYRNAEAVAQSLRRRNDFPGVFSYGLWQIYNRASLEILSQFGGIAVSFDAIQQQPRACMTRLVAALEQRGVTIDREAALSVFDASLPHGVITADPHDGRAAPEATDRHGRQAGRMSSSQQALASVAKALTADGVAQVAPGFALPPPMSAAASRLMGDIGASMAALAKARETALALVEAQQHTAERDLALAQLHRTEERYAQLAALQSQQVAAHTELNRAHTKLHADFEVIAAQLADEVAEKRVAVGLLADNEQRFASSQQALFESQQALSQSQQALSESQQALSHSQQALSQSQQQLAAMHQKADWLFDLLVRDYRQLLSFEDAPLGRVGAVLRRTYKLATGRLGRMTAYDQVIADARNFLRDHAVTQSSTVAPLSHSKWRQVARMTRYTLAHPYSAIRSVSWARLLRVLSVVRRESADDLAVWVAARFPEPQNSAEQTVSAIVQNDRLVFSPCSKPTVSIVIPCYNEYWVTIRCLASVLEHTHIPYEVIIADDCSSDETATITERVSGIVHIRHATNQRFLRNCNSAATHARGDYLLLLNNDTTVTPGWLAELLKPFADPQVGIVGPKLLFPNGSLQEAGGIVWADGSGWNYGRADDPARPQYNFVRETDYISGAALLIPLPLWQSLGGFDELFAPAYYEDTDLCFQVRAAGYKVVYQPSATVVHYEGVSNGTDLASGQKQYQVINAERFACKWATELAAQHLPNAAHVPWARSRSQHQRCILIIDHYVPHYDKDAGSRSTWMYVNALVSAGYRVQFMGANFFPHQPYTEALQQLGVEVLVGEHIARHLEKWLLENLPYVDHILLHRPHIAEQCLPALLPALSKQVNPPAITYIGHDLHFLRTQREAALSGDAKLAKEADKWREREFAVFAQVDNVVYFSEREAEEIKRIDPRQTVHTVPLYVLDTLVTEKIRTPIPELLFVAGFNHPPNIDAAVWFVSEVLPLIQARVPELHVHIAGSNPSSDVLALASDLVTVHGYVTDERLGELYARSSCAVVPLRFGAGVKGKVLEAIQREVPLVTTTVGAEGIPDAATVMTIADTAEAFADGVVQALLNDSDHSDVLSRDDAQCEKHASGVASLSAVQTEQSNAQLAMRQHRDAWMAQHFSKQRALGALSALIGPPRR